MDDIEEKSLLLRIDPFLLDDLDDVDYECFELYLRDLTISVRV